MSAPTLKVLSLGAGAQSPVVRRGGQWWLVTDSGSILATDPTFTGALDRFAAAMAAADQAIADLRSRQDDQPTSQPGRQR